MNFKQSSKIRFQRAGRPWRSGRTARAVRAATTLLEVILAIAILGGSLAVLGELVRVGTRAARKARILTTAQLLADSIAAEMSAGVTLPESTQGTVEEFGGSAWSYSVQVEPVLDQGLLAILVTVQENLDRSQQPVTYAVARWMVDPQIEADLESAAAELEAANQSASSDSSGTNSDSSGDAAGAGGSGDPAPGGGGR